MLTVDTTILTSQSCLSATNQTFQSENLFGVEIAFFFVFDKVLHPLVAVLDHLVGAVGEDGVETIDEVHETSYLFIPHGDVARGLIGHMHIVLLLHQSSDGTTHGDHVVVGVGREHDNAFGIGLGTLRTRGVVYVGLATGPSRDGVLQFVEHFDVHKTCLTVELFHEVAQVIVHIILR